jgi:hypothetical protein
VNAAPTQRFHERACLGRHGERIGAAARREVADEHAQTTIEARFLALQRALAERAQEEALAPRADPGPSTAAAADPIRMAPLLWAKATPSSKASCATNSDIVKPSSASMPRPASPEQVTPSGSLPSPAHTQPARHDDADRLADDQVEPDAERDRRPPGHVAPERHAGVDESEQRHDAEQDPRPDPIFELLGIRVR